MVLNYSTYCYTYYNTNMSKKQEETKKSPDTKTKARAWTFIIYEDSTDIENFKSQIDKEGQKGLKALYIRHDKDKNPDGTDKKIHWHIIIIWENPTTYNNALKVAQGLADVKYIEAIRDLVGASRYLTHQDNPEKYQYSKDEVMTIGDIEYTEVITSSRNDRVEVKRMTLYIQENEIINFDEFAYLCISENIEWLRILSERNTHYFRSLIQSQYFRLKEEKERNKEIRGFKAINIETGEIIEPEEKEEK